MLIRRNRRAGLAAALLLALSLVPSLATSVTAQATPPGFVTVTFGRMQWVSTSTIDGVPCQRLPNTVDLGQVHDALAARGIPGTGVVIPPRTPDAGFRCFGGYTTHPGWDLLEAWHGEGWRFVSGGAHADTRTLSYEQTIAETCGWLPTFEAHGMDAGGLFAYGNNSWTIAAQVDPTSRCFAYGRQYAPWTSNVRGQMAAPWFQSTHSVNGGRCNDTSLACYTSGPATTRYQSPVTFAARMHAAPDTWFDVQFYRFVTGSRSGSSWSWDCTSPDWRRHWTSQTELYCYGDFLQVMNALQTAVAGGGVQVADPGTVAAAWGRTLTPPAPGAPRSTDVTMSCGTTNPATCTARVRDSDDGIPLAPGGTVSFATDGAGSFSPTSCTLGGVRPQTSCSVTYAPDPGSGGTHHLRATYHPTSLHVGGTSPPVPYVPTAPDETPPTVRITFPAAGPIGALRGITIRADASDASGIAHVRFYVWTSTLRCTDTVAPYTCGWRTPVAGRTVTLRAIARDAAGNEATHSIVITTV